jgi:lipoprotein-anchoring transpeptidase ErfK/SrfK
MVNSPMLPARILALCRRAARVTAGTIGLMGGGGFVPEGFAQVPPAAAARDAEAYPRAASNWLEAQVELARRGFSAGAIDGIRGPQSTAALRAFQRRSGITASGELDDATRELLVLAAPALAPASLTAADLASLQPVPATWLEKSERTVLAHATALELAAERFHAGPAFLRRLNPQTDWQALTPETVFLAPAVQKLEKPGTAARIEIRLADRTLEVMDHEGRILAHFPVSIARKVEKRPVGELHVTVVVGDPNYTFDPEVFPESAEARQLGRKLIIPPGPNNPVGVAWIGLDLPGYGIHGTPDPEKVGRTESHGCFRLANWDAYTLLAMAWVGLPVNVEP